MNDPDTSMREMASEDIESYEKKIIRTGAGPLSSFCCPRILQINVISLWKFVQEREEMKRLFFAGDLLRMYLRYSEKTKMEGKHPP